MTLALFRATMAEHSKWYIQAVSVITWKEYHEISPVWTLVNACNFTAYFTMDKSYFSCTNHFQSILDRGTDLKDLRVSVHFILLHLQLQDSRKVWKFVCVCVRGLIINKMGVICPPPIQTGLTFLPKYIKALLPPGFDSQ